MITICGFFSMSTHNFKITKTKKLLSIKIALFALITTTKNKMDLN